LGKIFIMTGPVHTGKTTRLMQWSMTQKNIDGILQPVIDEKRFIYHLSSRTIKNLETDQTENITEIGRYKFSNDTFLWAQKMILQALQKQPGWLVIDEIGPLELNGKGLEPVASEILSKNGNDRINILCVVRDSIIDKFIDNYNLKDRYEIFNPPVSNI
jgi:nucleoside-triphosphatase